MKNSEFGKGRFILGPFNEVSFFVESRVKSVTFSLGPL